MTFVDYILHFAGFKHGPVKRVTDFDMAPVDRALADVRRESANAICASLDAVQNSQAIRKRLPPTQDVIAGLLRNL